MSSDSYMFIRQRGHRYFVSLEFMSDEEPLPITERTPVFPSLEKAVHAALAEGYTEYGIFFELESERA